jgi:hypothetical protein
MKHRWREREWMIGVASWIQLKATSRAGSFGAQNAHLRAATRSGSGGGRAIKHLVGRSRSGQGRKARNKLTVADPTVRTEHATEKGSQRLKMMNR